MHACTRKNKHTHPPLLSPWGFAVMSSRKCVPWKIKTRNRQLEREGRHNNAYTQSQLKYKKILYGKTSRISPRQPTLSPRDSLCIYPPAHTLSQLLIRDRVGYFGVNNRPPFLLRIRVTGCDLPRSSCTHFSLLARPYCAAAAFASFHRQAWLKCGVPPSAARIH